MSIIQEHRTNAMDMEEFDLDYDDRLYMERSCIREFVCPGQASVLYVLWDRADNVEASFRIEHFDLEVE